MYKSFWEAGREPRETKERGETHTDLAAKLHGGQGGREEEEGEGREEKDKGEEVEFWLLTLLGGESVGDRV